MCGFCVLEAKHALFSRSNSFGAGLWSKQSPAAGCGYTVKKIRVALDLHKPKGIYYEGTSFGQKMCDKCKIIRRHGKVLVICENPRHKQRQG